MTRSKELRRIERAIEHRDQRELQWALEYCRMRMSLTKQLRGEYAKYWAKVQRRVQTALGL